MKSVDILINTSINLRGQILCPSPLGTVAGRSDALPFHVEGGREVGETLLGEKGGFVAVVAKVGL